MNGKSGQKTYPAYLPPAIEIRSELEQGKILVATGLEHHPKEELPGLVSRLRSEVRDIAAPAARLMFILTVAFSPWRYRTELIRRPVPPIYADYTDLLLFAPDLFLLLTLLFWSASLALRPRRLRIGPKAISLPLIALSLFGLLSNIRSVDLTLSLYHSLRLLLLFGFYLYVVNDVRSLRELVFPALLLILTQSIVGIGQFLSQSSIGLQVLGEYRLDPAWSGVSIAWANGERFLRAYGLSDHPNILGGCLAFALILCCGYYVCCSTALHRPIVAAVISLGSLALLATLSRSAWIAFSAAAFAFSWFLLKTHKIPDLKQWMVLAGSQLILLAPFALYLMPYLGVRLGVNQAFNQVAAEEQSLGERQLLNQAANRLFADQPLTGIGLGAFPVAFKEKYPEYQLDYQPSHLVLLDVAAETGLFGALSYLVLLVSPWLSLWVNRRQLSYTPLLLTASLLLMSISLAGFFDYYTWLLVPGRIWAWLGWGLWGAAYARAVRGQPQYD